MFYKWFLAFLILIGFTGIIAAQERVIVFDFDNVGVDEQTVIAASQIFRNELNATGKFVVISKRDVETKLAEKGIIDFSCFDIGCATEYGYSVGAENAIIGSLTKLGEKITADASLISVYEKQITFTDRFSAISLDDLDVTLRKLAKAVANREKIESEIDRFAITEEETKEPRRKKSYITSGASFGFGFPLGDSYANIDNIKTLSWVMRYEAGPYIIDNSVGISWGSSKPDTSWGFQYDKQTVSIIPWDIGLRYVFSREGDFTPFIGGGLGFHFVASQDLEGEAFIDSDQAIALHFAGGIYGFQSYDFRMTLEGKYTVVFTEAFGADSGSSSHQIGISLGISKRLEKGEKRGCMSGGCLF